MINIFNPFLGKLVQTGTQEKILYMNTGGTIGNLAGGVLAERLSVNVPASALLKRGNRVVIQVKGVLTGGAGRDFQIIHDPADAGVTIFEKNGGFSDAENGNFLIETVITSNNVANDLSLDYATKLIMSGETFTNAVQGLPFLYFNQNGFNDLGIVLPISFKMKGSLLNSVIMDVIVKLVRN